MKVEHDTRHDTAYFSFDDGQSVRQETLDGARVVDYAADGSVIGVEFLAPSRGLNLAGVPHAPEIARAARSRGIPIVSGPGVTHAG